MGSCVSKSQPKTSSKTENYSALESQPQSERIVKLQALQIPLSTHFIEHQKYMKKKYMYEVIHRETNQQCLVGVIDKSPVDAQNQAELDNIFNWMTVEFDPNIQKVREVYETDRQFHVVKELVVGIPFYEYLASMKFSEVKFRHLVLKIMLALNTIHIKGIAHGGLCSEVILFENKEKDAKFKIITINHAPGEKELIYHKAPEQFKGSTFVKTDIWSLGVMIYFGLSGTMPFDGKDPAKLQNNIVRGVVNFEGEAWEHLSTEGQNLIKKMLTYSYTRRPTLQQCMQDPWFSAGKTKLSKKQKKRLQETTDRIGKFACRHKIQQAAMLMIIENFSEDKETTKMLKLFRKLDADHSGFLNKQEIMSGFLQIMPEAEAKKQVDLIFQNYDVDGSEQVDYNEFILAQCVKAKHLTKEKILAVFNEIDVDKSGTLSYVEVKRLLMRLQLDDTAIKEAIEQFDRDKNGEISKNEFVEGMMEIRQKSSTK